MEKGYKNFQDGIAKFLIEDKRYGNLGLEKATGVTNQRKKISAEDYKEISNWNKNKEIEKETKNQEKIIQENTITKLSNEVYEDKTNLKPFLGRYNVKDVENIVEKQTEIIFKQDLIIKEKDNLINWVSQAKGFNTDVLQEKYDDLVEENSVLKHENRKLKKQYKDMSNAFDVMYDIFKTFAKLIVRSPLIQRAQDTLHKIIKKFANAEDGELQEIQHYSKEYLEYISENETRNIKTREQSSSWEDEEMQ